MFFSKKCSRCGVEKILLEFYSNRAKPDHHESACITCFKKSIKTFKASEYRLDVPDYLLKEERWKDVVLEDEVWNYKISNCGRVLINKTNKIAKPSLDQRGYPQIVLSNGRKRIGKRIHKLVALHFMSNPSNLREINHKDGNKLNSHYSNLEYCTSKENKRHSIEMGLWKPNYPSLKHKLTA